MSNTYEGSISGISLNLSRNLRQLTDAYFACCCTLIGMISFYDALLVLLYAETMNEMEKNPICLALIKLEPVYVTWFLLAKGLGTLIVILSLVVIFNRQRSKSLLMVSSIAIFQLCLLYHLLVS